MKKNLQIRNSTAEFLTFVLDGKEDGVQVLYKDETIWATQKAMSILFDCSTDNISLHLKNIFNSNELDVNSTAEKISVVHTEGDRDVTRTMTFYNLDAVISVGYRVNSLRATQFRQWTTNIIRQFAIRGVTKMSHRTFRGRFYIKSHVFLCCGVNSIFSFFYNLRNRRISALESPYVPEQSNMRV